MDTMDELPALDTSSDVLLVQRTVAGDKRAYGLQVLKYQRRIQCLVGRMVRDIDLVEDICQETFIRAHKALHQFRGDAQFYTWLYRIVINTARKSLLELKRDLPVSENLHSHNDENGTSWKKNEQTSLETPELILAIKELAALVNTALGALPTDLRQALVLREIEGLSYEGIASAMDCRIGTVRSRIFRAREGISQAIPWLDNQSRKRW
jgi:RNA polymerase sigma-70 factor (ECF subfamily)